MKRVVTNEAFQLVTDINGVVKLKIEMDIMRRKEFVLEKRLEAKFLGIDVSELDAEALRATLAGGELRSRKAESV